MCFASQRRALFLHLNCQKWSAPGVFCAFWLGNVLRATTACTFSTSQLPKVVRTWCVMYILTWKCASRHNGVQFFISHLASWLRTRRFSEPTFRPSRAPNHWKNTVFRDFPTFSRICIFFLLTLLLSSNLSLLSASSLLCFSSVHIVESLTSKLPSIMLYMWVQSEISGGRLNMFHRPLLTKSGNIGTVPSRSTPSSDSPAVPDPGEQRRIWGHWAKKSWLADWLQRWYSPSQSSHFLIEAVEGKVRRSDRSAVYIGILLPLVGQSTEVPGNTFHIFP